MQLLLRALFVASLASLACACTSPKESPPSEAEAGGGGVPAPKHAVPSATKDAHDTRKDPEGTFEEQLFPPELVMAHQGELALTTQQREQLLTEIEQGQAGIVRLEWDLHAESEKVTKMLEPDQVDASTVQAAAAHVLELDAKVKQARLAMLLQLKNILTTDQQQALRSKRPRPPTPSPPTLLRAPESSSSAPSALPSAHPSASSKPSASVAKRPPPPPKPKPEPEPRPTMF